MNEEERSYKRSLAMLMASNPVPRGLSGEPRNCGKCIHRPNHKSFNFNWRGLCEVDEYMEGPAPCDAFVAIGLIETLKRKLVGDDL